MPRHAGHRAGQSPGSVICYQGLVVRQTYSVTNHGHRRPPYQLGEVDSKWFLPAWLDPYRGAKFGKGFFLSHGPVPLVTGDAQQGANLVAPVRQTVPDRAARSLVARSYFRNAQAVYVERTQGGPFLGCDFLHGFNDFRRGRPLPGLGQPPAIDHEFQRLVLDEQLAALG